ncbi:hypothetical protein SCUCBS95973_009411 [Sporothrix curviconia]|uniref:Class II aldolase/adducin N-terminal domain-containing protein n=1 Tax=Sporothrix curviconia TaxID=1260050 RepID=A0ABP0CVQ5_9PEZI
MAPAATILEGQSDNNIKYGGLGKSSDGRTFSVRSYPKFETLEEERLYRKQHLAAAFRVFADHGYVEGITGHISVRDPILPDHFWLNPISVHFAHIKTSDLVLVNPQGEVVIGERPIQPAAFAIHAELLKARPDINSAAHAHSIYGKTYSAFGRELEMITQDSLRFYKQHTVYKNFGGIVFNRDEGIRIAEALGDNKAVILQNHGILTVGKSPDEAAWWFLALENLCQVQLLADAAAAGSGKEKIVIDEEAAVYTNKQNGTSDKGWLAFQTYYDDVLIRSKGDFLQ